MLLLTGEPGVGKTALLDSRPSRHASELRLCIVSRGDTRLVDSMPDALGLPARARIVAFTREPGSGFATREYVDRETAILPSSAQFKAS